MLQNNINTVYLTGAGPGDIELLTVKALKIIQKADVIIYDRLANEEILKEAKQDAEFIFVGKEDKKHILPQEEINELLYKKALENEIVVRLKGGDPFVFGRGSEEAIYLAKKGIKTEVIPGITSAISVPALSNIPVTHRGVAVSFRVVTGHEAQNKEKSQILWETFIADETIVFLMGLHNLKNIVSNLLRIGKDKNTPVAIISNGTLPTQQSVFGVLNDILQKAKDISTPALIVVGNVVSLHNQM